LLNYIYN